MVSFALSGLVYLWVVRPFDKKLGTPALMLEKGIPIFSALLRGFLYTSRIYKTQKKNWYDSTMYGDFDFQSNASNRQRTLSKIYIYAIRMFFISGACFGIYDLF